MEKKIFVSVGRTSTPAQEAFVSAIEDRLRAEGLTPCTVGRNQWTSGAPLKKVMELMHECQGAVIIALERIYFPAGKERRGDAKEKDLKEVCIATPFNQVEAAMAYCHGHPLLVIAEDTVRLDGLLEPGNDWYVQSVKLDPSALTTVEFNGVLADWKKQVTERPKDHKAISRPDPTEMSVAQLLGSLKPVQLWAVLGAVTVLIVGAFSLGAKLIGP